jgi:hypothetical protein
MISNPIFMFLAVTIIFFTIIFIFSSLVDIYKRDNNITDDENKDKYMKYGSIYGKKYCVKTDYGDWDSEFTMDILEKFIK